jgi:hypothetical protein
MNRNDFLSMIENSGPADRTMISEVNDLISIFPYFQSAYLLLLKGLRNTADVKFENQLRKSAMHIADREVLYYLLKSEPVASEMVERLTPKNDVFQAESEESQQTVIETARNSDDFINEIEKGSLQEDAEERPLDQTVLMSEEPDEEDNGTTMFIIEGESDSDEERIIYMDPGFSLPGQSELLEIENEDTASAPAEPLKETISQRQLQSDLIERFIISNPRIEPRREKSETPIVDFSIPDVEEKEGFVTETLARIYVKQGYYSRAIDIYEKLSLKFPEKSSYFASQIEKVKEFLKK